MNLSDGGRQLILDCSIAHPVTGTRSANGALQCNDKTLIHKVKDKCKRHGC